MVFKYKLNILLFLSFLILHSTFLIATVRYVSHTGSSTPPYTSWTTAADSIQKCINICVFGDTIYVANGIYKEQVVMIPGLSLIGAGMDSCVIDTREFVNSCEYQALIMADSCTFSGFHLLVSNDNLGTAIHPRNIDVLIVNNKITNTCWGIYLFNSSSIIINNQIINADSRGIDIESPYNYYRPVIEENLIITNGHGVSVFFGTKPTIRNNIIFLNGDGANGYRGGGSDTVWVYNNLVVSAGNFDNTRGLTNSIVPTIEYNNFLIGNFSSLGIYVEDLNIVKNNNIMNSPRGIIKGPGSTQIIEYNNSWNNTTNYEGFIPDSTNLSVDPMVISEDSLDFHLQMFSPLINAGDPNILDVDGSRSDIGLYGGPFGESYKYLDLAPKPPRNLTAEVDTEYITLSWNRNTESDFKNYSLYRDTTTGFIVDSTTFIMELTDTFYVQIIPPGIDAFYYKLTAADNQKNISQPSEELPVIITAVNEYPAIISDYRLYQNYPNPFNPTTRIGYKLKERSYVKLYVYDIKGELVSTLVNQTQEAGYYEVEFSGERQEARGKTFAEKLASGIYIYQIMIKNENNIPVFMDSKKMLLIK